MIVGRADHSDLTSGIDSDPGASSQNRRHLAPNKAGGRCQQGARTAKFRFTNGKATPASDLYGELECAASRACTIDRGWTAGSPLCFDLFSLTAVSRTERAHFEAPPP